jgi:Tfp pilus assembly protein FimT
MKNYERTKHKGTLGSRMQGFSTVELVIVVAIILIVAGVAIPAAMQTWSNLQLRGAASEVANLIQQTRMLAAKKNATYPIRFRVNNGVQQAYIDLNLDATLDAGDPYIDLGRNVKAAAGAPTSSPTPYVLSGDTTSGTPYNNTNTLAFSSRGLPCNYDTTTTPATCTTPASTYFVLYFQDVRPNGWVAVCVTKAGRSKTLLWNGSSWN